ncbi:hypothetical protein BU26DRAFT_425182, partial [Trematosphaeria pertusa]
WAHQPFSLLPIPGQPRAPTHQSSNPSILYIARDIANVHNALLRDLNAIYLQHSSVYTPTDISDLTFYIKAWGDAVQHHHHGEETVLFPTYDAMAEEVGEKDSVMGRNVEQHRLFEPGFVKMMEYIEEV